MKKNKKTALFIVVIILGMVFFISPGRVRAGTGSLNWWAPFLAGLDAFTLSIWDYFACEVNYLVYQECQEAVPPVDGVCGATHYNCDFGRLGYAEEYEDVWQWWCDGWPPDSQAASELCTECRISICDGYYCGNSCICPRVGDDYYGPRSDFAYYVSDGWIRYTYCTPPTPVNGVCAATHYNCTAGNLGTWAEYTDSWQWWCNGIDGGSNTLCIETRTPVNGVCATTHYNCNAGTLGSVAEYADSWQWWCNGINGGGNILCTEVKTLFVSLSASPANGPAPLNDVVLTASVSGTVTGTINYKFDCTNDGTWDAEFDGTYDNPKTTSCSYPTIGTYTARVMVERGALPAAYGTALIRVSVPIPQWKEVAP